MSNNTVQTRSKITLFLPGFQQQIKKQKIDIKNTPLTLKFLKADRKSQILNLVVRQMKDDLLNFNLLPQQNQTLKSKDNLTFKVLPEDVSQFDYLLNNLTTEDIFTGFNEEFGKRLQSTMKNVSRELMNQIKFI